MSKLTSRLEGDTHVVFTRQFKASPEAVYRAHTEPALLQKWLLGPDGWTMPGCICEPHPGGKMRYEWANGKGEGFYIEGTFLEVEAPRRLVHIERMFLPDPTPENRVETIFEPNDGGTLMTMRMTLPDKETRTMMLASGMEGGMEDSYVRLDEMS